MIIDKDIEAKSNSELISELGARYKDYRIKANLTQKEVSEHTGISIFTISQFEKGNSSNITLGTFMSLLRGIGFLEEVTKLLPELPVIPDKPLRTNTRKERVRHGK